jgi:hypothetical protein
MSRFSVLALPDADVQEFVRFWSSRYRDSDDAYDSNIHLGEELTVTCQIRRRFQSTTSTFGRLGDLSRNGSNLYTSNNAPLNLIRISSIECGSTNWLVITVSTDEPSTKH